MLKKYDYEVTTMLTVPHAVFGFCLCLNIANKQIRILIERENKTPKMQMMRCYPSDEIIMQNPYVYLLSYPLNLNSKITNIDAIGRD